MASNFLSGKKNLFFLVLYFSDMAMFLVSIFIAYRIFMPGIEDLFYPRFFLFGLLIILINYSAYGLYKDKRSLFDDNDFMGILYSALITYLVLIVFMLMFEQGDTSLLLVVSAALLFNIFLAAIARFLLYRVIYMFRKQGYDRRDVIIFGKNNHELREKIEENKSLGYRVVKSTNDLHALEKQLEDTDIVFLSRESLDDRLLELIIENSNIHWKIIPSVLNLVIEPVAFDEFRDYPILNISPSRTGQARLVIKRAMDLLISGIALLLLSPLFLVIAIVLKQDGPVFFKQERLGKNLKPFMLYKFRTMRPGSDGEKRKLKNEVKGLFKMKDDPRITGFGRILRRSCIDELPQLINVFRGEMSVVGPRPHLQIELKNFKGWRRARFNVKPGLTGMWQVNGRHELNFDKAVLYDIYYIKHMSFILDIAIILKTIPSIIMSRGRF